MGTKHEPVEAFKGFDKDLKCRGYQYGLGETFEHKGEVKACRGGFHACENPLDVFNYYGPATSRFALVTLGGKTSKDGEDSKIAAAKITINAELSLGELTRRAVAWVAEKAKAQGNKNHAAGDCGHASAAGYRGHASAAGDYGHASAAGDYGHASAAGNGGHASAAGYRGHASTAGDYGHASAAGDCGHASAAGDYGHASAAGDYGHASAAGNGGIASGLGWSSTAQAGEGGAIMLTAYNDDVWPPKLVAVRSSMVGENGIEPGKKYRLTLAGEFEEVR